MSIPGLNLSHIAKIEISRIFNDLQLFTFESSKNVIYVKFLLIYPVLRKRSRYKNTKRLIPILFYLCLWLVGLKIDKSDLLAVSHITKADFNNFLMQLKKYLNKETRY